MKQLRTPKGSVSVTEDRGRIRIRWTYQQKRYSLNHSFVSVTNHLSARKLALQIEQDIALGHFDPSLLKYGSNGNKPEVKPEGFTALFEYWVKNYKQMDCDVHTNYNSTRNMIRNWGKVSPGNLVTKINSMPNSPVTFNRRLTILKAFVDWLVEQKIWDRNPLLSVKRRKQQKVKQDKREPFTVEEISKILAAVRTNAACSNYASTKHSFYYPFLYFLFKTGVRNAEAVGLRVKHIDRDKKMIHIWEVLARSLKSTTAKNRVRKSTKNEKERLLPLTSDLEAVLKPLLVGKNPDDLVFHSPTGKAIDDKNFRERIFKKVLKHLGIKERVLYAVRHTFGSRCIDQGMTPVMTAFLMGNNPETALRRYTHQLNIPSDLPGI